MAIQTPMLVLIVILVILGITSVVLSSLVLYNTTNQADVSPNNQDNQKLSTDQAVLNTTPDAKSDIPFNGLELLKNLIISGGISGGVAGGISGGVAGGSTTPSELVSMLSTTGSAKHIDSKWTWKRNRNLLHINCQLMLEMLVDPLDPMDPLDPPLPPITDPPLPSITDPSFLPIFKVKTSWSEPVDNNYPTPRVVVALDQAFFQQTWEAKKVLKLKIVENSNRRVMFNSTIESSTLSIDLTKFWAVEPTPQEVTVYVGRCHSTGCDLQHSATLQFQIVKLGDPTVATYAVSDLVPPKNWIDLE